MINVKLWAYGIGTTLGISRLVRFGRDATEAGSATSRTTEKDGKSGKSKTKQSETMSQPGNTTHTQHTIEEAQAIKSHQPFTSEQRAVMRWIG